LRCRPMTGPGPLAPERLYRRYPPDALPFETTEELEDVEAVVRHARALETLRFGLEIERSGYDLFVVGTTG